MKDLQLEDYLRSERPLDSKDIITIVIFLALLPLCLLCCGFFCTGLMGTREQECPHCTQRVRFCLTGRVRLKINATRDWSKDDLPWRYQLRMDIAHALGIRVAMVSVGPLRSVKESVATEVHIVPWSAAKRMYLRRRDGDGDGNGNGNGNEHLHGLNGDGDGEGYQRKRDGDGTFYGKLEDALLEKEVLKDERPLSKKPAADAVHDAAGALENGGYNNHTQYQQNGVLQDGNPRAAPDHAAPAGHFRGSHSQSMLMRVTHWRAVVFSGADDTYRDVWKVKRLSGGTSSRRMSQDEAIELPEEDRWKGWSADEMVAALCKQFKDPDSFLMARGA